jgi:hypothetical protein
MRRQGKHAEWKHDSIEMNLRPFFEEDSDFYDQEYYFNLEYRYLSGATRSRNSNFLASMGRSRENALSNSAVEAASSRMN